MSQKNNSLVKLLGILTGLAYCIAMLVALFGNLSGWFTFDEEANRDSIAPIYFQVTALVCLLLAINACRIIVSSIKKVTNVKLYKDLTDNSSIELIYHLIPGIFYLVSFIYNLTQGNVFVWTGPVIVYVTLFVLSLIEQIFYAFAFIKDPKKTENIKGYKFLFGILMVILCAIIIFIDFITSIFVLDIFRIVACLFMFISLILNLVLQFMMGLSQGLHKINELDEKPVVEATEVKEETKEVEESTK